MNVNPSPVTAEMAKERANWLRTVLRRALPSQVYRDYVDQRPISPEALTLFGIEIRSALNNVTQVFFNRVLIAEHKFFIRRGRATAV